MSMKCLRGLLAGSLLVLGACGGGGGSSAPEAAPRVVPEAGFNLSGTVSVAETSAVDSDTNDPAQAGRTSNNDFAQAQRLGSPVLLIGTVNQPASGPAGPNFAAGDLADGFRVPLAEGQVIELEFAADPASNDLDLYVYDETSQQVIGASVDAGNRYECVRIARPGDHYIALVAYAGASIYNLRIGAPTEQSACPNVASSLPALVPGQVIARAGSGTVQAREKAQRAGGLGTSAAAAAGGPALLRIPARAAERASGLERLAALAHAAAAAAVQPTPAAAADVPAALREAIDTVAYAKGLAATGLYRYVEPNRYLTTQALVGTYPPDDRLYPYQRWHYEMVGLPAAMERLVALSPTPALRPLVAVIDSGIVAEHPDLAPQIVDGYSFISTNAPGDRNAASPDDPSLAADRPSFHGTHVAGTVAAATFDGIGAAGAAPMAQLMPLRVFAPGSPGASVYDTTQAILYAAGLANNSGRLAPRRADVVNLSLGAAGACPASFQDAISQARAQGVIVVAAAGNEAANDTGRTVALATPANCAGVISVGALDADRQQAPYSNSGSTLVVAAPGGNARQSTTGTGLPDLVFSTVGDFDAAGARVPSFAGLQGTSMAAPHVAAVMALMRFGNPGITPAQVDVLFAQGGLTDDLGSAGRDAATGWGLINARKALDAALALQGSTAPPPPGEVVAQPSSLDFGALRTRADVQLALSAPGTERVLSVASGSAAVSVAARDVDPATGLGSYTVTVERSALPVGSSFTTLTVTTTSRRFEIQISVSRNAAGTSSAGFGRIVVEVIDADSDALLGRVSADPLNGRYAWSYAGLRKTRIKLLAGSDVDNDGLLCQRGEVCGAYPQLSVNLPVIEIGADRAGLDFDLAPFGGLQISGAALSR